MNNQQNRQRLKTFPFRQSFPDIVLWSHYAFVVYVKIYASLFHRLTRTAYLYNECLPWYNVVLTSRAHSSVKYSQQSTFTRATVESLLNHCLSWSKFVNTHLSNSRQWFNIHLGMLELCSTLTWTNLSRCLWYTEPVRSLDYQTSRSVWQQHWSHRWDNCHTELLASRPDSSALLTSVEWRACDGETCTPLLQFNTIFVYYITPPLPYFVLF